jgi:glycosyltransferase involved in cell wall biosynthesis
MAANRQPAVVSVCVSGFVGTNEAQRSIAEGSDRIRHFVLTEPRVNGPEARFLVSYFRKTRPQTIICGGWSEHYTPFVSLTAHGVRIAVYWTSSGSQTEIGCELPQFEAVLANRRITYLLFLDAALAASPIRHLKTTMHLPSRVPGTGARPDDTRATSGRNLVLSLFCSPHEYARKNVLNTLLAVAALDEPHVLYLNGLSSDPTYAALLKRLRIKYRDLGWMDRDSYRKALYDVDLGLQVSFVESYGQVVVDHLARGVPVVAATLMPALKNVPRSIRSGLMVANPDDWRDIHATIQRWIRGRDASLRAVRTMFRQIQADDAKRQTIVDEVLRSLS